MRKKLMLATGLGTRPAVFLGLLALVLLSTFGWQQTAQAQVYGNVDYLDSGSGPRAPSLGDLNGDRRLDLIVANSQDNTVSVYLGNGDWTFTPAGPATYATGNIPRATGLADLNGDGKLDLVVANNGSGTVSVFIGNGDGTFVTPPVSYATGTGPRNLLLTDVNKDGIIDLLVSNCGSNTVTLFLGIGNGTFPTTPTTTISTGAGTCPHGLRLADLNGDRNLDLAVSSYVNSGKVFIYLGDGSGGFTAATPAYVATGAYPTAMRLADLNVDGKVDLVVANSGNDATPGTTVSVFLGNGDGTFQAKTDYTAEAGPTSLTLADMNADGDLDLVVVNKNTNLTDYKGVSIFLGNGDGTFQPRMNYTAAAGPTGLASGDLNGDGMVDLVVAGTAGTGPASVSIFENTTTLLAVFPNGSGQGTITSSIGGINCPTSCRAYFSSGGIPVPTVTLTATPSGSATFIGWSGIGCSGTGTCTLTMDKSHTVSAMFDAGGADGFTQANLSGTWHFSYFTDYVTGNDPNWGSLTITLNASGTLTSGSYTNTDGGTGTFDSGAFIIDSAGIVSGWLAAGDGGAVFPYGKLSPSKTILGALSMEGPGGRGMIVGTKAGGTFSSRDLAGSWYSAYFADSSRTNNPKWRFVTLNMNTSGDVTGGSSIHSDGTSSTLSGGAFPVDATGIITSGSVTATGGGGATFPHGKLDASKTLLAAVASEDQGGRGIMVGVKGGGSFTTADLAGTWYFFDYLDRFPTNRPEVTVAIVTLNASGVLTSGRWATSFGNFGTLSSGSFTIDAAGLVSGSVTGTGGGGASFPHGKMDPGKSLIVTVSSESPNGIAVILGIKGGHVFHPTLWVTKAGTGTGTVTSSPLAIDCGVTCLAVFNGGDSVTLAHAAAPGSTFTGWSGDPFCTGTVPCILPMTESRSVTATFAASRTLTVAIGGSSSGSVTSSPAGIDCGATCSSGFADGTPVTLTASADAGGTGTFRKWRGDACDGSTSPTCMVTMSADKSVTAVFSKTFTYSLAAGVIVRAVDLTELREAIDTLRGRAGQGPGTYATDPSITAKVTTVKAAHLNEACTALKQAYPAATCVTTFAHGQIIRAADFTALRTAIRGLE
jgi:hypothetical protein